MNGKVFQLQSEQPRKGQFNDTMKALQLYTGQVYPLDSGFLLPMFKDLSKPKLEEPKKPEPKTAIKGGVAQIDEWDKLRFTEEVKLYLKNKERTESTMTALYPVVWGQCSRLMQSRCMSRDEYEEIEKNSNVVELLKMIKVCSHEMESRSYTWDALSQAKRSFYAYHQGENESNSTHVKNIKTLVSVIEHYEERAFEDPILIKSVKEEAEEAGEKITKEECAKRAKSRTIALEILKSSKYKGAIADVREQFLYRNNIYPKDITEAFELLEHQARRQARRNKAARGKNENNAPKVEKSEVIEGAQYLMTKKDKNVNEDITCYYCGKKGHYATTCPLKENVEAKQTGENHMIEGTEIGEEEDDENEMITSYCYHLNGITYHDDDSVLIDTGSIVSVFKNEKLLEGVSEVNQTMRALTNGGHQDSRMKGILPGFFPVWLNPNSRLNILAWSDVRRKFRITADTGVENAIIVYLNDNETMTFREVESGLYLCKMKEVKHSKKEIIEYSFLNSVEENKSKYSKRQVADADRAKLLYQHLGMPGYRRFFQALNNNHLRNCPVKPEDAKRAIDIYGPDLAHIKGKNTRPRAGRIDTFELVPLPQEIITKQRSTSTYPSTISISKASPYYIAYHETSSSKRPSSSCIKIRQTKLK